MANFKTHLTTGAIIGGLGGLLLNVIKQHQQISKDPARPFDWGELAAYGIGGGAIGAAAGVLPDVLEPASNPNHRKFFHSLTTGVAVSAGMYAANNSDMPHEAKTAINVAGAAYLSHLTLDLGTPKGLPIV